jgi:hypothetical protein
VPRERAAEVLEHARRLEAAERDVEAAIDGGTDAAQIARELRPDRW